MRAFRRRITKSIFDGASYSFDFLNGVVKCVLR